MIKLDRKQIVLHPVFFAIFPIIFLYSNNREEALSPGQVLSPLVISLLSTLALWGLVSLAWRNRRKSALVVSLFVLLFFSYGHLHNVLVGVTAAGLNLWQHRYLLGVYGAIFLGIVVLTIKTPGQLVKLTAILNLVSITLVAMSFFSVLTTSIRRGAVVRSLEESPAGEAFAGSPSRKDYPDIYYIILDAYAREDTLREIYDSDNSEFIKFLQGKGFYVASQSCSNYPSTASSLASSLNFEYLDYLRGSGGDSPNISVALYYLIESNKVVRFLKSRGYKFVHFDSGWSGNERNRHADFQFRFGYGNEFAVVLAQTTLILPFRRVLKLFSGDARNRIFGTFAKIAEIHRTIPGPKFVFAHIVCPHPPFLFGPQGEDGEIDILNLTWWGSRKAYADQVRFVNMKVEEMLEVLLSPPGQLPIVVIQADHGPLPVGKFEGPGDRFLQERMRILNTYFLPGLGNEDFYPTITPVNTFRLIFNMYFDQDLPLLADRSYYSGTATSYDFYDITGRVASPTERD